MLKGIINTLVDIAYPKYCHICHNRLKNNNLDNVVCGQCWSKIIKNIPPFCQRCGRSINKNSFIKSVCAACQRTNYYFDRAFSPCTYEGTIKELIIQFKYNSKDYLGKTLSRLLLKFIEDYNLELGLFDLLIPVPLHPRKLREREFNQAQVVGEYLASKLNMQLSVNDLRRSRDTARQTDLTDAQRWMNLKDSFCVENAAKIKEKNILLIDDVLTTGATCSEAARVLKQAGAGAVFVMTLAN